MTYRFSHKLALAIPQSVYDIFRLKVIISQWSAWVSKSSRSNGRGEQKSRWLGRAERKIEEFTGASDARLKVLKGEVEVDCPRILIDYPQIVLSHIYCNWDVRG